MKRRTCDANHCTTTVDANKGMCPTHWRMLPQQMQSRIYAAARKHRTAGERLASIEFLEAWADAVEYVAQAEGRLTRNTFRALATLLKAREAGEGRKVA